MLGPKVHTYHCAFCSHLLLASTYDLSTLPRRRPPGLDKATIVPLPPPPKISSSGDPGSDAEDSGSSDGEGASERPKRDKDSYTLLLTLIRDRTPKIITREDGFEKRHIWRCGRCRLVVGYQLDDVHYELGPKSDSHSIGTAITGGDAGADKDRSRKERDRAKKDRVRYLYVLPGAVLATNELGREVRWEEAELIDSES